MPIWTQENAREHESYLNSETGLRMLAILREKSRVPGAPTPIVPGIDLAEVARQSYAHHQGQSYVIDEIEKLRPAARAGHLPPDFQHAPPPKPE